MQDALIQYKFWPSFANYSHSFTKVLRQEEVGEFYRKLCDAMEEDEINFANVEFDEVDFTGARFLLQTYFTAAIFKEDVSFRNANFLHYTHFTKVNFHKSANFDRCYFNSSVEFDHASIDGDAFFQNAVFDDHVRFNKTNFGAATAQNVLVRSNFWSAEFKSGASFDDCNFCVRCSFKGTLFSGVTYEEWNSFSAYFCSFVGATFHGALIFEPRRNFLIGNFSKAIFFSDARFSSCDFQKIIFEKARFADDVHFHDVFFTEGCTLQSATIDGGLFLKNCRFKDTFDLRDVVIRGQTDLKNFDSTLNMRGAAFINHPPELFGSDLNPDSDLACILPKVPSTSHINIYEDVRQHAEQLGKLDDRKRFVHAELSCRAIDLNKSGAERFIWCLYGLTSNYGTSVYLPLFWLLILFLISAAPWMGYAIWFSSMSVWSALSYNILQAVPFTGHLSSALLNNFHELPMSLHFIAGPIALLNPIFWFLTGLGLRFQLRLAR